MCAVKNRNIKVALMSLKILQTLANSVKIIDHNFLIMGHFFLSSLCDFGVTAMLLKKYLLFVAPYY